ncbi:hemoglobin subunit beta-like [Myripristis murdjan]|uniref:Hemoglobin subunit epsilon 1 n=1 Tax=Myripristis murdjan TaxID=586833 RepID=A0A668ACT8_9TELE|nr:hemoglobin subunit beta-like [Myripristis murdjan]
MVEWTDAERKAITGVWGQIKPDVIGPLALARCLVVYPWTQRYFSTFGDLSDAKAIMSNAKVAQHGVTVIKGLEKAVQNMDDIKNTYAALSVLHSEKLHVDPDNFRLLGDCLTVVVASKMGSAFTPEIQAAWQKFLSVVVSALGKQYH